MCFSLLHCYQVRHVFFLSGHSDLLKKVKGSFKYVGEFSSVSDKLIHDIEKIDGVVHVDIDHKGGNTLTIYTDRRDQLNSEISGIAKEIGCSLYSMTESKTTLEDIFLALVNTEE